MKDLREEKIYLETRQTDIGDKSVRKREDRERRGEEIERDRERERKRHRD